MQRKLSPRPTFKPRLESLETRDLPSVAGIAVYMEAQNIQHGVQAMQAQANAAKQDFAKWGADIQNGNFTGASQDQAKLYGEIQAVRSLNTQVQAELQSFQQAVLGAAADGDSTDQTIAVISYLQVNGGLGALFGGSGSSVSSQAQDALNQVNQIASSTKVPEPNGQTITLGQTLDQVLNS